MKNYVLRDAHDVYEKNVIEIDDVEEWTSIKMALKCYIEKNEDFINYASEKIKRIESGNAYEFDESIEKAKEDFKIQLRDLNNLKELLVSLDLNNEIKVNQLEVKYR